MKTELEKYETELENVKLTTTEQIGVWVRNNSLINGDILLFQSIFEKLDIRSYGDFRYLYTLNFGDTELEDNIDDELQKTYDEYMNLDDEFIGFDEWLMEEYNDLYEKKKVELKKEEENEWKEQIITILENELNELI